MSDNPEDMQIQAETAESSAPDAVPRPSTTDVPEDKKLFFSRFMRSMRLHLLFYVVVVLGIVADIGTKVAAFAAVDPPIRLYVFSEIEGKEIMIPATGDEPDRFPAIPGGIGDARITRTVIPGFLNVRCSFNPGAMFGILPNRDVFLIIFTTIAVAIMLGIVHQVLRPGQIAMHLALGFICAGALGNLWDRFHFHAVRDFLDFHVGFWPSLANWLEGISWIGQSHWPTFNVADIFICTGVILVFIKQVIGHEGQKLAKQEESEKPGRPDIVQDDNGAVADDSGETVAYSELYGEGFVPATGVVEPAGSDADDSCATVAFSDLYGKDFDPTRDSPEEPAGNEVDTQIPETFPRVIGSPGGAAAPEPENPAGDENPPEAGP